MRSKLSGVSVFLFSLLSFECCLPQAAPPQGSVIYVDVLGLRNNKGQVLSALYASAEGFPKDSQKAIRRDSSAISEKKASCEFSGIEPGTYAVSVFHDENSNGKLDTNFLGIPREGVGASNDARGHLGPAQIRCRCLPIFRRQSEPEEHHQLLVGVLWE
jgi:uncharacterized protein (DUF2141 family)